MSEEGAEQWRKTVRIIVVNTSSKEGEKWGDIEKLSSVPMNFLAMFARATQLWQCRKRAT